jgi:Ca2+-dependent lipid-binding protein
MATLPIAMPKVLRIFDISASNLKNADWLGQSDPYCKVIVDGREIGRTDVITNNLNPKWTAAFEIQLYDVRCSSLSLEV